MYSSSGNGGCRTVPATDNTRVPYGYELSTRSRGERIATWARSTALKRGHVSRSSVIDARRKTFFVPLENALFAAGAAFGVLPEKDAYLDGQKLSRLPNHFVGPLVNPQPVCLRRPLAADRRRRVRERTRRGLPLHLCARLRRGRRSSGAGRRSTRLGHATAVAAFPVHHWPWR